ncbi:hypothetical protein [Aquimarina muelleri]|uniref:Uncharacterized protein n=1 Tax=Aquimarina muelleri TaxID=279356 RepID=A0A918JVB7_9FLAO|nr:hypothetical protein [Aquimarina muelleri]MCX2762268.1 hypothetical protein [Aquimarina muelleri]GGX17945.1 hypothetical protein GCM10007384_19250 [Aquimarina muelleri]
MFTAQPIFKISTIVYYQYNIDTIIKKFCINKDRPKLQCNGKCHLLSKIGTTTDNNKKSISIKDVFSPLYFKAEDIELKQSHDFGYIDTIKNWSITSLVVYEILYPIDHPPEYI